MSTDATSSLELMKQYTAQARQLRLLRLRVINLHVLQTQNENQHVRSSILKVVEMLNAQHTDPKIDDLLDRIEVVLDIDFN